MTDGVQSGLGEGGREERLMRTLTGFGWHLIVKVRADHVRTTQMWSRTVEWTEGAAGGDPPAMTESLTVQIFSNVADLDLLEFYIRKV